MTYLGHSGGVSVVVVDTTVVVDDTVVVVAEVSGMKSCGLLETRLGFPASSTAFMASTYFSFLEKGAHVKQMSKDLTEPPTIGSRSELRSISATTRVFHLSLSKFAPVKFPAVDENLTMYSATASLESRSSPGAVNWTLTTSPRLVSFKSVTWPGGRLSTLRSTSFVTRKDPPAACLEGKSSLRHFILETGDRPGEVASRSCNRSRWHGVAATAERGVGVGDPGEDPAPGEATIDTCVAIAGDLALDAVPTLAGVLGKVPGQMVIMNDSTKKEDLAKETL